MFTAVKTIHSNVISHVAEMIDISAAERHRKETDNILSEWKSDISTSGMPTKKGPRTMDYDKQKGRFKCTHILSFHYRYVFCLVECPAKVRLPKSTDSKTQKLLSPVSSSFSSFSSISYVPLLLAPASPSPAAMRASIHAASV